MDEPPRSRLTWHARLVEPTPVDAARRQLLDFTRCAACGASLTTTRCTRCGLDLGGADGARIADASWAAVRALDARQEVVARVRARQGAGAGVPDAGRASGAHAPGPSVADPGFARPTAWRPVAGGPGGPVARGPVPPRGPGRPVAPVPAAAPERTFDVARLFVLAGAGLVAAAALVFAFFFLAGSPGPRVVVMLVATAGAVAGTLALRRSGLGASAEAVGGLVAALAVVDAWMIALLADGPVRWLALAFLLLAVGVGLPAAGLAVRVRAWTVAVLVLPLVPLCVAAAWSGTWAWHLALLAAALVTLVRAGYRRAVAGRFGTDGAVVDALLALAALALVGGALVAAVVLPEPVTGWETGGFAVALLLAAATTRAQALAERPAWGAAAAWVWVAGGMAVLSAGVAVASLLPAPLGTVPLAAAAAWAVLVLVPRLLPGDRATDARYRAQVAGGWTALVLTTGPGVATGVLETLGLLGAVGVDGGSSRVGTGWAGDGGAGAGWALAPGAFDATGFGAGAGPVLAAVVLAGALAAIGRVPLARVAESVPVAGPRAPGQAVPGHPGPSRYPVAPGAVLVRATVWRQHAAVVVGRVCLPAGVVLAAWLAVALLRSWSVPLLVAETVLAAALVEVARRVPAVTARTGAAGSPEALPGGAPGVPGGASGVGGGASGVAGGEPGVAGAPSGPRSGPALVRPAPRVPWRATLVPAAFAQVAFVALLTWASRPTTALGAVAVAALLLRARALLPRDVRALLVGLATAYAGAVLAAVLAWSGWDGFGVVGGVAVALLVVAAALAVLPRVGDDTWLGVLVVALVPAAVAVAAVAVDRTWWGAGAAAALLLVEVLLLDTRRRPVPSWARVTAAALVLPTVAVVVICAGAVLLPGSGSPVLLPVVAVLAAAAAVAAPAIGDRLRHRAPGTPGDRARVAVELAAAGTGAVALLLGIARTPTGADTVLVLCALLGAGATAVALRPDRRLAWWPAALLWCGVAWSALVWWGVGLVEAYTAPPALAAVVVGTLLARRGDRWRPLVAAGVALLVAPTLLLAVAGRDVGVRSAALLAGAALAVATGVLDRRRSAKPRAWSAVTEPLLAGGAAAALAGAVRAAHLAASTPVAGGVANARLFGAALLWSLAGAVLLGALGRQLVDRLAIAPAGAFDGASAGGPVGAPAPRGAAVPAGVAVPRGAAVPPGAAGPVGAAAPGAELGVRPPAAPTGPDPRRVARDATLRRWALAPALLAFTVGALVAVRPSWALTWTGWVVELGLLALAVAAVRSEAARPRGSLATDVPPGWVLWLAALAWAIGAWSPRELRVEVFALPLGLALTAMGWVALRASLAGPGAAPDALVRQGTVPGAGIGAGLGGPVAVRPAWPVGRATSLATLTPGILATLGPSMLAIWTDPMTWRAILVVVLALGFMLEGAREMLRAPLVLGAGALPVAVLSVFAAQLGRTISAGPWLLTLLAAGGLLLVLGVFAERRRTAVAEGRTTAGGVLR